MPRYEYVLFDADNTLFDFDAAEHLALGETLERFGIPVTGENRAAYLAINRALWAACDRGEVERDALVVERFVRLLDRLGLEGDAAAMNDCYLDRLATHGRLLDGAEELCAALAPHCTLAIVTNGVTKAQKGRYGRSPVKRYIPHLFISQEMGVQKPQREFFDRALSALDVTDPRKAVVVGDSLSADIQGAVNAGLDSIWYDPKGLPAPATPAPTYIACSFGEIKALILG